MKRLMDQKLDELEAWLRDAVPEMIAEIRQSRLMELAYSNEVEDLKEKIAILRVELKKCWDEGHIDHDEGCPGDDTCTCEHLIQYNQVLINTTIDSRDETERKTAEIRQLREVVKLAHTVIIDMNFIIEEMEKGRSLSPMTINTIEQARRLALAAMDKYFSEKGRE